MGALWETVLPVLQEINTYGGNFTAGLVCRAVIDEIDRSADSGDQAMIAKRQEIEARLQNGNWPCDFEAFNAFFETYHEAVFYLLAARRSLILENIPRKKNGQQTPDFRIVAIPIEGFEVKTIDVAGGALSYNSIMENGLDSHIEAAEQARRTGIGISGHTLAPHGKVANNREAIEQVMRQVARNVKFGQFAERPTFLVVAMTRTALRTGAAELDHRRFDGHLGGEVSGHLWTIAAHRHGEEFFDATVHDPARSLGRLGQGGILRDYPFVRGVLFLTTEWSELPGCDRPEPFPEPAFCLLGVWNDAFRTSRCPPVYLTGSAMTTFRCRKHSRA